MLLSWMLFSLEYVDHQVKWSSLEREHPRQSGLLHRNKTLAKLAKWKCGTYLIANGSNVFWIIRQIVYVSSFWTVTWLGFGLWFKMPITKHQVITIEILLMNHNVVFTVLYHGHWLELSKSTIRKSNSKTWKHRGKSHDWLGPDHS